MKAENAEGGVFGGAVRRPPGRLSASLLAVSLMVVSALLGPAACVQETDREPPGPNDSAFVHGSLVVSYQGAFPPYWGAQTTVSGRFHDGPSPEPLAWREQAASGDCRVLKPEAPFCDPGCGTQGLCTAGGVCVAFPRPVSVGSVTVDGLRTAAGASSLVMNPVLDVYRPAGATLADTPFTEGAPVSFHAAGGPQSPAFTVSARGLALPGLLNDSLVLDGRDILLRWTPPGEGTAPSGFEVHIDISHHGGVKGTLACYTEDDGALVIDGGLVNELKALGVSGYPQIDLIRRTNTPVAGQGINLIVEARILRYVTIPGLVSCREDAECPAPQTCRADFRCE